MQTPTSDFSGKTYWVSGASSGIGASTALALGSAGARVALVARRRDALEAVAVQIRAVGGEALVLPTDVTDDIQVRDSVIASLQQFGRLDGAFNNAGVLGASGPIHLLESTDLESVFRSNVLSVFWSMKHQIKAMLASGGGSIVNTASIAGELGFASLAPYVASKHAVLGLTKSAALEYFQSGIRINAVAPGPVHTPMAEQGFGGQEKLEEAMRGSPAGRPGMPAEISGAVLFLLSPRASYMSGQTLKVDGGYSVA